LAARKTAVQFLTLHSDPERHNPNAQRCRRTDGQTTYDDANSRLAKMAKENWRKTCNL